MGETIRTAVQLALGGFISLAARSRGVEAQTPTAPAVDGAYQLGRGEARSGRSVDALLSAYRLGARVAWREMSSTAVRNGVDADTLARFAELVFAYIDELSASSVAGHNEELATTGRVRQRLLERMAGLLLDASPEEVVAAAAERAGWTHPQTLTAAIVPEAQVRAVLAAVHPGDPADHGRHRGDGAAARPGRPRSATLEVPEDPGRPRRGRRPRSALAGGARLLRPGPAGARARSGAGQRAVSRRAGARRRRERDAGPARTGAGTPGGEGRREHREADRDPALLAAAPRSARGRGLGLFVHPQTVRVPDGEAGGAARRPAGGSAEHPQS